MVDFRYHLVSIISVFLALALGIVIGTAALNGQLLDNLQASLTDLSNDKRGLEATVGELRSRASSDQRFAEQIGPIAVANQLQGQRVLLVSAPEAAAEAAESLGRLLAAAGATVTGDVRLRPDLLDPEKASVVAETLGVLAPSTDASATPSLALAGAATGLAQALLSSDVGSSPVQGQLVDVLAAEDLIDVATRPTDRATLSVLITGSPSTDPASEVTAARARAVLSFAAALDVASTGAVVAGPVRAAEEGGALRALREDVALSEQVSSVDGADQAQGQIAVVYALAEQQRGGSGSYGSGPGSQEPLPSSAAP